jgi:hypothetical protein
MSEKTNIRKLLQQNVERGERMRSSRRTNDVARQWGEDQLGEGCETAGGQSDCALTAWSLCKSWTNKWVLCCITGWIQLSGPAVTKFQRLWREVQPFILAYTCRSGCAPAVFSLCPDANHERNTDVFAEAGSKKTNLIMTFQCGRKLRAKYLMERISYSVK